MTPSDPLSVTLAALADPTRRGILARLALGEATVNDLAEPFDMTVQAVSKHIKVLEGAGLVSRGREAQFRPCRLEPEPFKAVQAYLDDYRRFWDRSMDALADYLREMPDPPKPQKKKQRRTRPQS